MCSNFLGGGRQVAKISVRLMGTFLNNSSSRWESIFESFPLEAELLDRASPIYRSDFQRSIPLDPPLPLQKSKAAQEKGEINSACHVRLQQ